jgi:hypothetical protein
MIRWFLSHGGGMQNPPHADSVAAITRRMEFSGALQPTASGERATLHAERIEREIGILAAGFSGADDRVSGTVRVTSVPIVVNQNHPISPRGAMGCGTEPTRHLLKVLKRPESSFLAVFPATSIAR